MIGKLQLFFTAAAGELSVTFKKTILFYLVDSIQFDYIFKKSFEIHDTVSPIQK